MMNFKEEKGITLVGLAVTIIVILILAGVSLMIANTVIVEKVVTASAKTTEAYLKEQIELAWVCAKMELYDSNYSNENTRYNSSRHFSGFGK